MSVRDRYRANWPRVGGLLAMGTAGAVVLGHRRLSKPQLLSAMNLVAVMVHQYEEYEDPGYFPGQFKRRRVPQRAAGPLPVEHQRR